MSGEGPLLLRGRWGEGRGAGVAEGRVWRRRCGRPQEQYQENMRHRDAILSLESYAEKAQVCGL